jgi:hypothetical protein
LAKGEWDKSIARCTERFAAKWRSSSFHRHTFIMPKHNGVLRRRSKPSSNRSLTVASTLQPSADAPGRRRMPRWMVGAVGMAAGLIAGVILIPILIVVLIVATVEPYDAPPSTSPSHSNPFSESRDSSSNDSARDAETANPSALDPTASNASRPPDESTAGAVSIEAVVPTESAMSKMQRSRPKNDRKPLEQP